MLIGFLGDVHGLVYHAIALVATWQHMTDKKLDLVIQVGDMGAFPTRKHLDEPGRRYIELDPAQADFSRLLEARGRHAERLRTIRGEMVSAIHFLRGNHEDFPYLSGLRPDKTDGTAMVDNFDVLRYVPDGTILQAGDVRIAFLGGIETEAPDPHSIDTDAYELLMDLGPESFDIIVTHEPPYGVGIGYRGHISGSKLITSLIEHTQPRFHFSGHVHHLNGPRSYGRTSSWSLDGLISSVRWHPEENGFRVGCLAVLDTSTWFLQPVTDSWLGGFDTKRFEFDSWYESYDRIRRVR